MKNKNFSGILLAVSAAALYALNAPCSKLLLAEAAPTMLAALLYLGAGTGMFLTGLLQRILCHGRTEEKRLTTKDLPYTAAMVLLDIAAPVLLMAGLSSTTAANASLLNNFEIAATSVIALWLFHEKISPRLWAAIFLVTTACIILSFEDNESLRFSRGSLLVLLACVCWGFENNCTRRISGSDALQIVVIKGIGSGLGSLGIALLLREPFPPALCIIAALLLGFVAYGLSIFCYIRAQRTLGAAKTSTYYAIAPFIGTTLSLIMFRQMPGAAFLTGLAFMLAGTYLAVRDESAG